MARPKMPDGEARDATIAVRVRPVLRDRLEVAAREVGVTPSAYVRDVLRRHFEDRPPA
jgi:predicted DNA-binding protein